MIVKKEDIADMVVCMLIIAIGIGIILGGSSYDVGSVSQIGSGFFPVVIGSVLAVLGVGYLVSLFYSGSAGVEDSGEPVPFRAIIAISGGIAFWGATVKMLGLVPAIVGLVVLSSFAETTARPIAIGVLAVLLAAATCAIFIFGLDLPLMAVNWQW